MSRRPAARRASAEDAGADVDAARGAAAGVGGAAAAGAPAPQRRRRATDATAAPRVEAPTARAADRPPGDDLTDAHHHRRRARRGRASSRSRSAVPAPPCSSPRSSRVAAFELYEGFRRAGFQPATLLGLLGSRRAGAASRYNHGDRRVPAGLRGRRRRSRCSGTWSRSCTPGPMVNVAVTLLGFAYVGVLGGFAGLLLASADGVGMHPRPRALRVGYDVVGYFVGSQHRARAARAATSRRTRRVEGLARRAWSPSIVLGVDRRGVGSTPWNASATASLLGLVVAIVRAARRPRASRCSSATSASRTSARSCPGHGGVLDRFDAMLFCLPAVYYLVALAPRRSR